MLMAANVGKQKTRGESHPYLYHPEVIAGSVLVYVLPALALCISFSLFLIKEKKLHPSLHSILWLALFTSSIMKNFPVLIITS